MKYIFLISLFFLSLCSGESKKLIVKKPCSQIGFSDDVDCNTKTLQALLNKGDTIDLTYYKKPIKVYTLKGNGGINALTISKFTYLRVNAIQLIGTSDSIPFHLFHIKHGNFDVIIDGNLLPPLDASPKQPTYDYKFPNILDTWTYNDTVSANGYSRTITLKNSKNTKGYWCGIIKNTGGGFYKDSINWHTFRLENVEHITRSGGIKMFSGNRPYSRVLLKNVRLKQIMKKGQKHHDHLGYIHENVTSHFDNVYLSGCHFDFRSTAKQSDTINAVHNFKNVIMEKPLSMQIKDGGSTRTNSHTYFENSYFSAGNVYGYLTLKNTDWWGNSWKQFTSLGGNTLSMSGYDLYSDNVDLTNDSIRYMSSFIYKAPDAIVKVNNGIKLPTVANGKMIKN